MAKNTRSKKPSRDMLEEIADKIVASLEVAVAEGTEEFEMPWTRLSDRPRNFATGRPYTGMNAFNLMLAQMVRGFSTGYWLPRGYCKKNNISFAGARSEIISVPVVVERLKEDGTEDKRVFFKNIPVFNIAELKGVEMPEGEIEAFVDETEEFAEIDEFVAATGAIVNTAGQQAFYSLKTDEITMPPRELFRATKSSTATQGYYSTLLHELVHWSGAEKREARFADKIGGRADYAKEELVAEIGAAVLGLNFGLAAELREDNRAYVADWAKALDNDVSHIREAAKAAVSAARYLERTARAGAKTNETTSEALAAA
ncbi:ArdC family protein [Tranquillimonas alkanivorans]|uniref:Antirestriction protein ArdC n=1 Tax=Tranquillimonas alkanivorans TaxID=441119 RepID=A0A1I5TUE3_9RHOB|nr:zincin-like metallopeptidase domain-containing protein [Tranquillimonas alkanivorans]SFP86608.1 Antirestriction protein ArdC [Tranquillimonas alkanivorans]